jgi:ribose transport system ATP-binding protein
MLDERCTSQEFVGVYECSTNETAILSEETLVIIPRAPFGVRHARLAGRYLAVAGMPGHALNDRDAVKKTVALGVSSPRALVTLAACNSSGSDSEPSGDTSDPKQLLRTGTAVVPGNRQRDGVWLEGTGQENITLLRLKRFFRWPSLRLRQEATEALALMEKFGVRPLDPSRRLDSFSGGNQQKIVMGKWLSTSPKVMLLDEPTQGVDAGARRRDILDIVASAADAGSAVAIFSSDIEQLFEMCDRVVVMAHGRVSVVLNSNDATEHSILSAAHGDT